MTLAGPMALEDLLKTPALPACGATASSTPTPSRGWPNGVSSAMRPGASSASTACWNAPPLKTLGFDAAHARFEQAQHYSDWVFGLPAAQVAVAGVPALQAP